MKKINLAITGCLGKMGQQLIKSSKNYKNFNLITVTENRIISRKILVNNKDNLGNFITQMKEDDAVKKVLLSHKL